jgi:putative (di)nucleoside polyphosphate hydrolase
VGIKEKSIKKIYVSKTWYKYDVPEAKKFRNFLQDNFRGQKQKWFMFELIEDVKIDFTNDPNPEFDDYMWSSYWYPLYSIVDFKKEVYRSVLKEFCQPYVERFS